MSDLDAFFEAANHMHFPDGEEGLEEPEKDDIRLLLHTFVQEYPTAHSLFPVLRVAPLSPWTGANLFGHLQPFCV
jgi:hypothetical protein